MSDDIVAVVTGIGTAGAIVVALVKAVPKVREAWLHVLQFFKRVDDKAKASIELQASLRAMRRVAAIENVLEQWLPKKNFQRALLLTANNGGQAWKGGGPLYVSNPSQVRGFGEPDTRELWRDWKVDSWYITFLGKCLEAYSRKVAIPVVCETDVQGELREQYQRQGTFCSLVLPFKWLDDCVLWYVSLNFGRYPATPRGAPEELSDSDEKQAMARMRDIANDPPRCRALVDELRAAYDSVR